mmetsp:Transcript_62145/g.178797  ORF Transcript_62145/g.178797 Transcript_62145/m.178797 type:complete len:328 (-) Transcript_62145:447-1430(-)
MLTAAFSLGFPRQAEERQRSPSAAGEAQSSRSARDPSRGSGKVEFVPRPVEDDAGRREMPILPLHLLKSDQEPGSVLLSARGQMPMQTSQSVCSVDSSAMSVGGGFSDTASMASLMFGGSSAGDIPAALRSGDLPAVPDCFKCKLSHQVMQDPVRLPDGSVCERANIAALQPKGEVKSDPVLAEAIRSYFELRKESEKQQKEWQTWLAGRNKRAQERLVQRQRQIYALRVALEQSRKKVSMLEEKNMASSKTASTIASSTCSPWEDTSSDPVDNPDVGGSPLGQAAAGPNWRSGPAPRSDVATPATRRASERRRSTWSFLSGKAQSP